MSIRIDRSRTDKKLLKQSHWTIVSYWEQVKGEELMWFVRTFEILSDTENRAFNFDTFDADCFV